MNRDLGLDALAAEGDPESDLAERELHAALDAAVRTLDTASAEAIAAMLGAGARPQALAPAVFRKRVSRAYGRLRVLLGGSR